MKSFLKSRVRITPLITVFLLVANILYLYWGARLYLHMYPKGYYCIEIYSQAIINLTILLKWSWQKWISKTGNDEKVSECIWYIFCCLVNIICGVNSFQVNYGYSLGVIFMSLIEAVILIKFIFKDRYNPN